MSRIFELYFLRRSDNPDPFYIWLWEPFYVGRGKKNRAYSHRKEAKRLLKKPKSKNTNPIRNAIIHKLWAQGLDYVEDVIFIELTNGEANQLEIYFIAKYGRINLGTGCLSNLTDGGESVAGMIHSEETKKFFSETRKGENNPCYGVPCSEERKRKISEANSGKVHNEESRKKMSIAQTGRKHPEEVKRKIAESRTGVPLSEEHKQKLSEVRKGRILSEEHKLKLKGRHPSEETRKKMSESHKGERNGMHGKHHTEKAKNKIGETHKGNQYALGRQHTDEERAKISEARKLWLAKKKAEDLE